MANGNTLRIQGSGAGSLAPYVHGLRIDEIPTTRNWLRFGEVSQGATIEFRLGSEPDTTWGAGEGDAPQGGGG